MPIRIAINGFGRIGRAAFKIAFDKKEVEVVALNDLTDSETLAHLLKYDSVFRNYHHDVKAVEGGIMVDGKKVLLTAEKDPLLLPWRQEKIDVVLECTGRFTEILEAEKHITAGAHFVVVSAPMKGGAPTFVFGANHEKYGGEKIVNNASCTTNCIAPVAAVLSEHFGIAKALMTTVHAITAEQNVVDAAPPGLKKGDLRRARAAYQNIVPTSTGAARATGDVVPELKGLFDGLALRVPVADVSLTDFVFVLKKKTTVEELNAVLKNAVQEERYKGILGVTEEPVVSSDFIGSTYSSIVDLSLTKVIDGDLVKVIAWYDNEWGYSNRLVEMAILVVGKK